MQQVMKASFACLLIWVADAVKIADGEVAGQQGDLIVYEVDASQSGHSGQPIIFYQIDQPEEMNLYYNFGSSDSLSPDTIPADADEADSVEIEAVENGTEIKMPEVEVPEGCCTFYEYANYQGDFQTYCGSAGTSLTIPGVRSLACADRVLAIV